MAGVKIIGKVGVKVMPDTTEFKDELKKELEKIEKQIGSLKVNVIPEITKAHKEAVKAEMNALQQELSGKNIEFDLGIDEAEMAAIEGALDALARKRKAEIEVDVDRDSLGRALDKILMLGGARPQIDGLRKAFEMLGNLDYVAINVGTIATKVAFLAGAALSATSHVLTLAGGLVKIVPAGLALPGIFGGIAIGLGATAAALADFNKYVPQAKGLMADLQNTISGAFWAEAAGPINTFINGLFPVLNKNLAVTGEALGGFFANLAKSAGVKLNPALGGMFDALNESIDIFAKHTDSIVQIIKVLGETGSKYLPVLADWFGKLLDDFAAFLTKAQGDGSLNKWIDDGIHKLKMLGGIIAATGSIFSGLFDAANAGGGIGLGGLNENLHDIADVVNSPGFQKGLADTFRAANEQMSNLVNGAGPGLKDFLLSLRDVFIDVAPGLGETMGKTLGTLFTALSQPNVGEGIRAVFEGITNAANNMTPAIKPMVDMFASFGPVIGAMLTQISAFSAQGMDKLGPTITGLAEAAVPLINKLGDLFLTISEDLTPVFQVMGENMKKVIEKCVPLVDVFKDFWNVLSPLLIPVLKIVAHILGDTMVAVIDGIILIFKGLTNIIKGVVDVFKGIGDVISGIFSGDSSKIGEGFGKIFGGLKDIALGALQVVGGAIWTYLNGTLLGFFKNIALKLFGPIIEAATGFAGPLFKVIEAAMKPIQKVFEIAWKAITVIFEVAFAVIKALVVTVFNVIKAFFVTYFEGIKLIFTSAWEIVTGIFSGSGTAILNAIKGAFNAIKTWLTDTMDAIYFVFKGPIDDVATFLSDTWASIDAGIRLIWNGIRDYFTEITNKVRVLFSDAWTAISKEVTDVWNGIKTFFTEWFNNLWDFYWDKIAKLKSFLKDAWNKIKDEITQVWGGIKSFFSEWWGKVWDLYWDKIAKLKELLGDAWDSVKTTLKSKWDDIKEAIASKWEDFKSTVGEKLGDVKSKISGAWDDVKTTLKTKWDEIVNAVTTKIGDVVTEAGKIPEKITGALVGLGTLLYQAGKDVIQGLINGIKAMFTDLKSALESIVGDLPGWAKKLLGIHSPSRVFKEIGTFTMQGLVDGIADQHANVMSTMTTIVDDLVDSFDGTEIGIGLRADLDTSNVDMSAIGGLTRTVSKAAADAAASSETEAGSVHIDNITIPLEDLKQLQTLEEFLDMLRVRTRQGVNSR